MDGVEFLSRASTQAPDTVRVMLTGYADVQNAMAAVNEGRIFRFLAKPCDPVELAKALAAGVKQYRLVTAEKQLLEQTLMGSIKMLTEVLSLLSPESFGRASRLAYYVKEIARQLDFEEVWEFETAALLCQIGYITLPEEIVKKARRGEPLNRKEAELFAKHPKTASDLVSHIPRMEGVREIIAFQEKRFDGSGFPENSLAGEDVPLGSRILKVVLDFDALVSKGYSKARSLAILKNRPGWYDPAILTVLEMVLGFEAKFEIVEAGVYDLEEGMILADDIIAGKKKLLAKGQALSETTIRIIRNYHRASGVDEPLKVIVSVKANPDV
jgi:response regulator RpfG family c-di-GMP phosphodiesterase